MFIDDGIGIIRDKESAVSLTRVVREDLSNCGFIIAEEKCVWEPTQKIKWLGVIWDGEKNLVEITECRVNSTLNLLLEVKSVF